MNAESDKPTIIIRELGLPLEEIPPAEPCYACGKPTQKSVIEWGWEGDRHRVVAENFPGYKCMECGTEYGDPVLSDRFLELAAQKLSEIGDLSLREILNRRKLPIDELTSLSPLPIVVTKLLESLDS